MTLIFYLVIPLRILRTLPLLMELTVNHFDIPNGKIPKTYVQINTLKTGDADLRLYITTVQDG